MSRGNAGAAQSAGAVSVEEVDYQLLFERGSSECLVLCPDAPRFTVVEASDAYLAATGGERAAILGRSALEAFASGRAQICSSDASDLCASLERVRATQLTDSLEIWSCDGGADNPAATASPRRLTLRVNAPVLAAGGALRYILHRVHDLDACRQRAQPAEGTVELTRLLRERSAELENAKHELEAFNYSIAHDLRAPLRAIDGFSQALASDFAASLDGQAKHYLERVRAGALRMSVLIDSLLELSHLQRATFRRSAVDLGAMVRTIFEKLQKEQPERAVQVRVAEDLLVHADPGLTSLALEQLCKNAWKFTAKKAQAEIAFGRPVADGPRAFCLRDDGVGFEMAHASRLFSPFQRLHKPSEFEGTGIGLALVQRVVSRHGGRVWVEAQPGSGATFFFTLEADHV